MKVFRDALHAYEKGIENGDWNNILSMDSQGKIQALFFVGTDEELKLLIETLKDQRNKLNNDSHSHINEANKVYMTCLQGCLKE